MTWARTASTEYPTPPRERVLAFIADCDYSPTIREIADECGFASPSTAHYHVLRLEADGLIERVNGRIVIRR